MNGVELEGIKNFVWWVIGNLGISIDVEKVKEFLRKNDVQLNEFAPISYEIQKVNFVLNKVFVYVINVLCEEDLRHNWILVMDFDGNIIELMNGYEEKIENLDVYELIRLYRLFKEFGNKEKLKRLIIEHVKSF